jgi:hypothetical protein
MMAETLLRTNRRAAGILSAATAWIAAMGVALVVWGIRGQRPIVTGSGAVMAICGGWLLWRQLALLIPPRLGVTPRHLLVYLRGFLPWRVPLEHVECFFIGQAPSRIRVKHPTGGRVDDITVVVRLAERATSWHHRPADSARGQWKDGYITILGAWCEPLDGEVVKRMNHRLAEVKRPRRVTREGHATK